ncbi:MAG: hypothetical protein J5554_10125 [Paludibacteraceae bacterium]|nr:hypothetical protein [Paludibacteraceae bacterium]
MKFKYLTWAVLLGALSFGAASCEDDDDDDANGSETTDEKDKKDDKKDDKKGSEETSDTTSYIGQMFVDYSDLTYRSDSVNVKSSYDSLGNVNLDLLGVRFVPQMPVTVNLTVPSIPKKQSEGVITFQADTVVPTMSSRPVEKYTAYDIKGEIKGDSITFSLKFGDYPTSYKGKLQE